MKINRVAASVLAIFSIHSFTLAATNSDVDAKIGEHFRVIPAANGTDEVTLVGNGLNYQDTNGAWIASVPVVRSFANAIVCEGASYRVILATNLNTSGSVDLELPSDSATGQRGRMVSHPLGLAFYDPDSGATVLLAALKDCSAQVVSNQVIFADAFVHSNGVQGAVTYTYGVGHFHQDITLTAKPSVTPGDFGMGSNARLEMLTQFEQSPEPEVTESTVSTDTSSRTSTSAMMTQAQAEPAVTDQTLDYGTMRMGRGRAFSTVAASPLNGLTVTKQLISVENQNFLTEDVPWTQAVDALQNLPVASGTNDLPQASARRTMPRELMIAQLNVRSSKPIAHTIQSFKERLAEVQRMAPVQVAAFQAPPSGFVLDYELVQTCDDFTFQSGHTYLISTYVQIGYVTIESNSVIKYSGGVLEPMWSFNCPDSEPKAVLTDMNDDSVGAAISGSVGHFTTYHAYAAVDMSGLDGYGSYTHNLDIRFVSVGIAAPTIEGNWCYIYDSSFFKCGQGIYGSPDYATLSSCDFCEVDTPYPSEFYELYGITYCSVDRNGNGLGDSWEFKYFGSLGHSSNDLDSGGVNTLLYDYMNSLDPNIIDFSFSFPNQYVRTNIVSAVMTILAGIPSRYAVLVGNTNFSTATWSNYTSPIVTVNLGSTQGAHDVWIGLRGLPSDAQQTWEVTTLVLDSVPPSISITNPINNASFNASRIDIHGNFTTGSLKDVVVNGVLAFVNGTNFAALGVPLNAGSNAINAVVEDFTGATNVVSINVNGLTNSDGSMNDPVQLSATPLVGFAPLAVTFQITSNSVPGTFQAASYDFNGDGTVDFVTNNLGSFTNIYATNGEYFPVVTIQTSSGFFSSSGGWNSIDTDRLQVNVQSALTQTVFASVSDPIDLKLAGTNLYVLSGSGATITEFNTNASTVRSLSGLGTNPSGFDVDYAGNVYVAITSSNQVWKFIPTNSTFVADTSFGAGGRIGLVSGLSGTGTGEFNAPFDVAVSPDGGTISVSDSGNNRIQQFSATNGLFVDTFGTNGSATGEFNSPKGLAYDSSGTLYIMDTGNNRIALAQGGEVLGVSGTNGAGLLQFNSPKTVNNVERGTYIADTANNRIQCLNPLSSGVYSFEQSDVRMVISTNLNQPSAAVGMDNLTNEMVYVADSGNNRVLLYTASANGSSAISSAWSGMLSHGQAGDISGAIAYFSLASANAYQQSFLSMGTSKAISALSQIGPLAPVYVLNDRAEYYFTNTIDGQIITFPVDFVRENGVWKIVEF